MVSRSLLKKSLKSILKLNFSSRWFVPSFICYIIAFFIEIFVLGLNNFFKVKLEYSPRSVIAYGSSVLHYDRLRADVALDYDPLYKSDSALKRSGQWYDTWYLRYKEQQKFYFNEIKTAKALKLDKFH